MRLFYLAAILFLLFIGINGIVRTKNYASAIKNGQYAEVVIVKKNIGSHGRKELKVLFNQKRYWVEVARSTYDSVAVNKKTVLKYDSGNDMVIDEKAGDNIYIEVAASVFFLLAAVGLCLLYKKAL